MKKIDYLKLALLNNLFKKRAWIISAFTIIKEADDKYKSDSYYLRIVQQPWGYSFINDKAELEKIDDAVINEPLFRFKDAVQADSTWAENIKEPVSTYIGNLFFNNICILSSFGAKHQYVTGIVSVPAIEDKIALLLKTTPDNEADRSTEFFYVDEYIKFIDSLQYLGQFSQISTWSATRKGMTPPTGILEFKKELEIKYKGKLTDPVEFSKYEKELKDFDENYLKGDPANNTFIKGKVKNISRKKMFLTLGAGLNFDDSLKITPVLNSLNEGWPTDPVQLTVMMNDLRAASFSRGSETVKGGVSAKILLRAANNFKIQDGDCGSTLGITRVYNDKNVNQLVGRYIRLSTKIVFMENKTIAADYLNRELIVRSPMYCKLPSDNLCEVCAGTKLSKFRTGLTIPLTEISSIILTSSLKAMHGKVLATAKLHLESSFS